MWEWKYAKEPFDLKMLVLRLMKNIWIPVIAALVGAAIIGGGYYLKKVVFGGPDKYEMTSMYCVEYGTDPDTGNEYTYINYATWQSWVTSDWFVDRVWEKALSAGLEPAKYNLEKADLKGLLFADVPSDVRIPTSTVITENPELTERLGLALEKVFIAFGQEKKEIDQLWVADTSEVTVSDRDVRTLRACVLGAVLSVFFTLLGMLLYFIMDDSIRLPETFTFRYGIPALGAVTGWGEDAGLTDNAAENLKYVFRGKEQIAVTAVSSELDLQAVVGLLPEGKYVCIPSILQVPEAGEKLRESDGILLLVQAGAHDGKQIEHMLHELRLQDCSVDGALLVGADERLLKAYRLPGYERKRS